ESPPSEVGTKEPLTGSTDPSWILLAQARGLSSPYPSDDARKKSGDVISELGVGLAPELAYAVRDHARFHKLRGPHLATYAGRRSRDVLPAHHLQRRVTVMLKGANQSRSSLLQHLVDRVAFRA